MTPHIQTEVGARDSIVGYVDAAGLLPENQQAAILRITATLTARYQPADDESRWLVKQLATATIRIETCQLEQEIHAQTKALEASILWETSRRLEAAQLAEELPRDPAGARCKLLQFAQGCDLVIEYLETLVRGGARGGWSGEEIALALDLLGVPYALRSLPTPLDPQPGEEPRLAMFRAIQDEIARLKPIRAKELALLDHVHRGLAERGMEAKDRRRRELRAFEQLQWRQVRWLERQLELVKSALACPDQDREIGPIGVAPTPLVVAPPAAAEPEPFVKPEVTPCVPSGPPAELAPPFPTPHRRHGGFASATPSLSPNAVGSKHAERRKASRTAKPRRKRSRR